MPSDPPASTLLPRDLEALAARGIPVAEAERQLALLRDPPPPVELVAAATAGRGIEQLAPEEHAELLALWREAAQASRLSKLVPASGAASRMFASLQRALSGSDDLRLAAVRERSGRGDATAKDLATFAARVRELPFHDQLATGLTRAGAGADGLGPIASGDAGADLRPALAALLGPAGLGYSDLPKGLIPFHRRQGRAVTPVEEHCDEALLLVRDARGAARIHFTVAAGAEDGFRSAAAAGAHEGRIELGLSHQSPATDTLAADEAGRPFRDADGNLLFRPGGHGSLLRNLEELDADLVLVKNIDNVQPAARRGPAIEVQRLLVGLLARLQRDAAALLDRLEDGSDRSACHDAAAFLERWLDTDAVTLPRKDDAARRELAARLDRPLRVAGMVKATGEPGGGPFWTRDRDGVVTKQIVETAEIAPTPEQQRILRGATHFNPVLMALALRDRHGRPYRLADFVDPTRVFVTSRTSGGRALRALEHPGLWNGSMARWGTVFVEIPGEAFTPVKTVLDLLRPEHQAE